MQIVVLDGYCVNPGDVDWSPLKAFGTLSVYDRTHPDMVAQRLRGADVVFVNKVRLNRDVLFGARNLKFIGVLATGYDVVDLAAARERGIIVTNVPAYSTEAVAQHTIALLLALCQHVEHHAQLVRNGAWTAQPDFAWFQIAPTLLAGKTGTAQTDRGKDHSWFTCFAPEKAPRIVVTVVVEHGGFGASAALPVARAVLIEADKSGCLR